jgi:outer membrane lipoprotein-sorting protein
MSRRSLRGLGLIAALAFGRPLASAEQLGPQELLDRADRTRAAWDEAVITIEVEMERPGEPVRKGRFEVAVKGRDRARVRFLDPADEGKLLVMRGDDSWLILPSARNPIKVPKSHRLTGGFSVGDVSRIRFGEDYDAVLERQDVVDGLACEVLRLSARKGRSPSYPIARVWVDTKGALLRKAVFLVASGKTAREVRFEAYRPVSGVLSLSRMTILDTLRPGTTRVDYLTYEKRSLPDSFFDPATARSETVRPP